MADMILQSQFTIIQFHNMFIQIQQSIENLSSNYIIFKPTVTDSCMPEFDLDVNN